MRNCLPAYRLYHSCLASGKPNVRLVGFPSELRLGHNGIFTEPNLPQLVREFIEES